MPRLISFGVKITTGEHGHEEAVRCCINGHTMALTNTDGHTGPGGFFTGDFTVNSFVHSLTILGPDEGQWEISEIEVSYECADTDLYTAKFGAVALDESNEVNIWTDPTPNVFYV